jgi:hypothetical protein
MTVGATMQHDGDPARKLNWTISHRSKTPWKRLRCGPGRWLVVLCFVLLAPGIGVTGLPDQAKVEPSEWAELFNGEDLQGWTAKIRRYPAGENHADTFRVEEGLLTVSYDGYSAFDGKFGHLFYQNPYSHYRLRLEYRFVGDQAPGAPEWANRNSGVMLHSQAPESMPPDQDFPISIEVQFLGGLGDGQPRPTGNMCSPGTHIVYGGELTEQHCINSTSPTFDDDGWVRVEVLVLGDQRIVHYINDEKVMEYGGTRYGGGVVSGHRPEMKPDGEPLSAGYISLQSEGHPVQFRHVELLDLKGCMDPTAVNFKAHFVESDTESCRF